MYNMEQQIAHLLACKYIDKKTAGHDHDQG